VIVGVRDTGAPHGTCIAGDATLSPAALTAVTM
jgi:hypothetical protein